jgi:hypothetical protein
VDAVSAGVEPLFCEVNEKIKSISDAFGIITGTVVVICECSDPQCIDQIEMAVEDYDAVRADPALFIVRRGHEPPSVGSSAVRRAAGFTVIRASTKARR